MNSYFDDDDEEFDQAVMAFDYEQHDRFSVMPSEMFKEIYARCGPAALISLRSVAQAYKEPADDAITNFAKCSHLALPEVVSADRSSNNELRELGLKLEEGWRNERLMDRENLISEALEFASPGGQVSWAPYNPEKAEYLMGERYDNGSSWLDVEDFKDDDEDGEDDDWMNGINVLVQGNDWQHSEVGWHVSMDRKPQYTRRQVMAFIRKFVGDLYGENAEDAEEIEKRRGNEMYVAILQRVWGLLMEPPRIMHFVEVDYDYRHTDYPRGMCTSRLFIETSQGKKYELVLTEGYQVL